MGCGCKFRSMRSVFLEELQHYTDDVGHMIDLLRELGYKEISDDTQKLFYVVKLLFPFLESRMEDLRGIWKAVDCYENGDWNADDVKKEADEYMKDRYKWSCHFETVTEELPPTPEGYRQLRPIGKSIKVEWVD